MSETGLYGLFIMLYLLIKCWVPKQRIIILSLLRQGHYFINGFPFYLWLFYYIAKENWALRAVELEKEEQERHRNLIKVINSSSA